MALTRFMIDIEGLSLQTDSIVAQIACCEFGFDRIGALSMFYTKVDVISCEKLGMRADADTVLWWLQQSEEARAELVSQLNAPALHAALDCLSGYIKETANDPDDIEVWAKGPRYDLAVLETGYHLTGLPCPWKYNQWCDVRTALRLFGSESPNGAHQALNDCHIQIQALQRAIRPELFKE